MIYIRNFPGAIAYVYHEAVNAWRRFWYLTEANRNPDLCPW